MILLDNSEYMRNGDYIPTRLEAQQDAANLLVGAKTQSHPESTVGVSAGTDLLVSPTDDVGKILSALHGLPFKAEKSDVAASVQVASLALKHRRNKNGGQRIVLFVGSPMGNIEPRVFSKAGRQLKKNNIAIDVVVMGESEENEERLQQLVEAANGRSDEGNRTCHLVTIPAGVLPSDVLASSPIVHGAGGGGGGGGAGFADTGGAAAGGGDTGMGTFAEFGGVDPNMDPELAMALRVSMEEERARQERATAAQATESSNNQEESKDSQMEDVEPVTNNDVTAAAAASSGADSISSSAAAVGMGLSEEEALLQQALAMSMNENDPPAAAAAAAPPVIPADDEDAAMQMALAMSMQVDEDEKKSSSGGQQFQDPQFVNQLLGSLPGVDPNDPQIQNALRNIKEEDKKKESEKKKEDPKE